MKHPATSVCFVSMEAYATLCPGRTPLAGGAGFQVVELARGLRDAGVRVGIVVGDFGQEAVEVAEGIRLYRANRIAHDRSVGRALANLGRLFVAMRRAEADVYVLRSTRFLAGFVWLFSRLLGKRFVFMVANRPNCLREAREGVPGPLNRLYAGALRGADLVTVQASDQQELLRREFGIEAPIVRNGFRVPPRDEADRDPEYDIAWIGSLMPVKGPDRLAEVARANPDLRFLVIGGPGADEGFFERSRAAFGELDNVDYRGFVPPDRIGDEYARARFLINTSLTEGFPNTFLYAWSRGVPTISLGVDPGGVIAENDLGLVDEDPEILMAGVRELRGSAVDYAAMANRCYDYVRTRHDLDAAVTRFMELTAVAPAAVDREEP